MQTDDSTQPHDYSEGCACYDCRWVRAEVCQSCGCKVGFGCPESPRGDE